MNAAELKLHGLDPTGKSKSSQTHMRRLTVEQAQRIVELLAIGRKGGDIARELGITHSSITAIKQGWHWTVREGHVRLPEKGGAS